MKFFKKAVIIAVILAAAFACVLSALGATYGDTSGHWAESHIEKCTKYNIVNGDEGNFYPELYITRAELATMIDRLMGYADCAVNDFDDLEADKWYTESILHLANAGVMLGNGLGSIRPEAKVTREEAVSMIARSMLLSADGTAALAKYSDAGSIAVWAQDAVAAMTERGYIDGVDGAFLPQEYMKRGEAAKIFAMIIGEICTETHTHTTNVDGNLIIKSASGARVSNITVKGDVVITPQVDGTVHLKDVDIKGNLVILCDSEHVIVETTPVTPPTPEIPDTPIPTDKIKIYIDPGHGFGDPGTVYPQNNPTVFESEITLKLSLMVCEKLEAMGFEVKISRDSNDMADNPDTSTGWKMSLPYRYKDANKWDADLFISIHVNAFTTSTPSGIRSYYPTKNASSETLSKRVQYAGERLCKTLNSAAIKEVGECTNTVSGYNYDVLKYTDMLSALFEIGFITNSTDRANMQNDAWLEKMATGLANGIAEFANNEDLDSFKS